ncbi:MAG: RNA 2',3'-cyclic phosphodiesterase [Bacteroidota bacterium]|nr:RNA 2',3'-cyclic phosphodiesterase [Bacteroidota bacterium]MDO9615948.1 RNA 2',3'-cyclic phosphodiesterase [Bacteroidota bacterium]
MLKRLFIGAPIESGKATKQAGIWKNDRQLNSNQLNWTKPENWHITLFFLGDTTVSKISLLQNLIDESFNGIKAFKTELSGLGVFPNLNNPKVLWMGLTDIQPLLPGRNQLGELLQQNGFPFDNKPLKPHLTLARIKFMENRTVFDSLLNDYKEFSFGSVEIDRVVLYESILTPHGSVYKPVFEKQLIG